MDIDEIERRARARLAPHEAAYVAATAGSEADRIADLAAWDAVRFRPVALRGPSEPSLATTVLGTPVASPALIAPMAQQIAAHPEGEIATAEAAQRHGTLLGVSTNTAFRFADIDAVGAPWWFQLYLLADRDITLSLVERAVTAGARALILTVDTTALRVDHAGIEPTAWPDGPARHRLENLTRDERSRIEGRPTPNPSISDIDALARASGLPIIVKGVVRADDAQRAVDAGAAGIIVSTHGARRMDGSITTVDALADVVDAVGDQCEVYADSGIRSGRHVLAALALGARAVFVGRPIWWALAADGADGIEHVLAELDTELASALRQSGLPRLADAPELL